MNRQELTEQYMIDREDRSLERDSSIEETTKDIIRVFMLPEDDRYAEVFKAIKRRIMQYVISRRVVDRAEERAQSSEHKLGTFPDAETGELTEVHVHSSGLLFRR